MVKGEYQSTFGIMILDEEYNSGNNITDEMNSVYLHESVHHIQTFSTVYGIDMAVFRLSRYLEAIRKAQNGVFPMSIYDSAESDFVSTLFGVKEGMSLSISGEAIKCHEIQKVTLENEFQEYYADSFPENEQYFEEQVVIHYHDNKVYYFGGEAICESMAYLFEQYFYNVEDFSKAFPYNACQMLYEFVVGKECVNLPVLIALCYASLMSAFPGKTFYTLLCRMKSDNYEPQNMEEVFIYAEQEMCEVSEQQIKNLFERIDWAFPTEIDEVTGRDFVEPLMSDLIKTNRWLKDRYQYVSQNEYDFRKALIYVLEEVEESKRITAMRILLDEYSHPIVIDRKGMLYGEKKELVSVLGPYAIQEIVINRQKTCAILGTCKALKKSYTVECSQCCWREKKTVCILRFYLYVMGLGNVDFAELEGSPFEI